MYTSDETGRERKRKHIMEEIISKELEKKGYYLMTMNHLKRLSIKMGDYECYAVREWDDFRQGVVTDLQIVQEGTYPDDRKWARVRGRNVDVMEPCYEDMDFEELNDVKVIGGCVLFEEEREGSYHYKAFIDHEFQEVHLNREHTQLSEEEKQLEVYEKIVRIMAKRHELADEKTMMEICIRNFVPLQLDSASKVVIYEKALFEVVYPDPGAQSHCYFVVGDGGRIKKTEVPRFAQRCSGLEVREISLNEILVEMDKLGISVGEDSGHEVPGVSKQERELLSTHKLTNGTVLVMYKASEYCYGSQIHLKLLDKVCCGVAFWAQRFGEKKEFGQEGKK